MLSNRSSLIPPQRALWLAAAAVFAILVQVAPQAVAADTGTFGTVDVPSIGDMVVMPDGSILGSDLLNSRIYRVWPSGAVTVFAWRRLWRLRQRLLGRRRSGHRCPFCWGSRLGLGGGWQPAGSRSPERSGSPDRRQWNHHDGSRVRSAQHVEPRALVSASEGHR